MEWKLETFFQIEEIVKLLNDVQPIEFQLIRGDYHKNWWPPSSKNWLPPFHIIYRD